MIYKQEEVYFCKSFYYKHIKKTKTTRPRITFEIKIKTKMLQDGHVGGAVDECSVCECLSDTAPTSFPGFQNQVPSRGGGVLSGPRAEIQSCSADRGASVHSFPVLTVTAPSPSVLEIQTSGHSPLQLLESITNRGVKM